MRTCQPPSQGTTLIDDKVIYRDGLTNIHGDTQSAAPLSIGRNLGGFQSLLFISWCPHCVRSSPLPSQALFSSVVMSLPHFITIYCSIDDKTITYSWDKKWETTIAIEDIEHYFAPQRRRARAPSIPSTTGSSVDKDSNTSASRDGDDDIDADLNSIKSMKSVDTDIGGGSMAKGRHTIVLHSRVAVQWTETGCSYPGLIIAIQGTHPIFTIIIYLQLSIVRCHM